MNYRNCLLKSFFLAIILLTSLAGYGQGTLTITAPSCASDTCELYYAGRHESVVLDKSGRGKIELNELMIFCYVTINDKVKFNVYTGDQSLQVNVGEDNKAIFHGTHARACEHLNNVIYPYFITTNINTFSEFKTKLNAHCTEQLSILKNANVGDKQFEKHQQLKFEYSNAQRLLQYFVSSKIEMTNEYKRIFKKLSVEDKNKTFSTEYTFFLYAYSSAKLNIQNNDAILFDSQRIEAIANYVVSRYKDKKLVEAVLHHIAVNEINRYGNSSHFDTIYRKNVTSEILLKEYNSIYKKWENVMAGVSFPTLDLTDVANNFFDLSKYKGKYVVIDMWATWCTPCIREQKAMIELETVYKDIIFITISCDKKRAVWQNYVKKNLHGETHFNTINSNFNKTYGITTIPRFMLLNKDGKILSANFYKPSSLSFKETLDSLLK